MAPSRIQSGNTPSSLAQRIRRSVEEAVRTARLQNVAASATRTQSPAIQDRFDARPAQHSLFPSQPQSAAAAPLAVADPPPTTGALTTTEQANAHHVTQWGPTPYNAGGTEYGFSDCVPTSGVIALSRLGLIPPPGADGAPAAIDGLRDASYGYDTTSSNPMGFGTLETGLAAYGAAVRHLDHNDLSAIDAALESGNPVMAAGGPWNAWGAEQYANGNYLNTRDPGPHAVTILGKTEDGNYIVADPLCSRSTIEVSEAQLRRFFADGGGNSGAMEVMRADGETAPAPAPEGSTEPGAPRSVPDAAPEPGAMPSEPTAPATAAPQAELERGMQSAEVEQLQNLLVELGFMTPEEMATGPGIFGPRTERAVGLLQQSLVEQGLMTPAQVATGPGRYGPRTRAALNAHLGAQGPGPATPSPPSPDSPSSTAPDAELAHLDGINPPADNASARVYWAQYVRDEVMPRLTALGVDPRLIEDAVWFGLSEGIYTVANNPGYGQTGGNQSPVSFSNFADSHNWGSDNVNGRTAFPPGLPYNGYGWRSGNWQVGIAGAQVVDAVNSGNLAKAYKMIYGDLPPEAVGQQMLGVIGEGQRDFPNLSIEALATQENQQWAAVLLRDPLINVLVQTMNPHIVGPHGYGREIVDQVFN